MCRWMAYTGGPILIEDMLFKPEHSLIDQSMSSRSAETPTNGDGFGVGWYNQRGKPGLYRSIRPAWNDFNLRDLCGQIETSLFLAHVRATSQATVQETNCHPFRHERWMFVHNGEVFEIEKMRRDLLFAVAPHLFPYILGSTDSEIMFFLALTFGLDADPLGALARMAGLIEDVGRSHGVEEALWMTVAVSDGESLHAVRYASDGDAPSLYHSRETEELFAINPELRQKLTDSTRVIVSEPVGRFAAMWEEIPQSSSVSVVGGRIESRAFAPTRPS